MSIAGLVHKFSPFNTTGRLIRLPLKLIPSGAEIPILTGINRGMRWIAGSASSNAPWAGVYEADHMEALKKIVRPGMVAFDVGANVGFYTFAFSRLVGDTGRVYSFEPDGRNSYMLQRHIELNRLQNVSLIQAAISSESGLVGFAGKMEGGAISKQSAYQIPAISLDEFVRSGNPEPSFIKMDIQGAERAALDGAVSILSKGKAAWLMATHSDELRESCKEFMARYGYRFAGFDCKSDPGNEGDFVALPAGRVSGDNPECL